MRFTTRSFSLLSSLFFVACTVTGCSLSNSGGDQVAMTFEPQKDLSKSQGDIGPDEENTIGRAVAAKLLATFHPITDRALILYVNRVGKAVAGYSSRPNTFSGYSFVVIDSAEINAMAAPGGYIFISRGLLELLRDEDMLAAVLAHEIAHVIERHGLESIDREHMADYTPLTDGAISAIDCSGLSQQLVSALKGAVDDIVDRLLVAGYSREQELEADRLAVEILKRAGYDPAALHRVLEILSHGHETDSGGWFSTHPEAKVRLTAIGAPASNTTVASAGFVTRQKRFESEVGEPKQR